MKVAWLSLLLCLSCTAVRTSSGYTVFQTQVFDRTLSCKGDLCCWPWKDKGEQVVVCAKPLDPDDGTPYHIEGLVITVRGRLP